MKRSFAGMLALALALGTSGGAMAATDVISGNVTAGQFLEAGMDGALYFSLGDGLDAVRPDGTESRLNGDDAKYLQAGDGMLYYVSIVEIGEDSREEQLIALNTEDGTRSVLGDARSVRWEYNYGDRGNLTDSTIYIGYRDMTVYGDYIYFVGNDAESGSYETHTNGDWAGQGASVYETRYAAGSGVFRMNMDGSGLTELISGLGNGGGHMAIANGRIAVASCWKNAVFSYDFSDFKLYDLNGNLISTLVDSSENRHSWLYREDVEFTVIVEGIQTDGENIYASLGDSEGDFASSRLVNMNVSADEMLALEAFYNESVVLENGIVYTATENENTFTSDIMETTLTVNFKNTQGGGDTVLAYLPKDYAEPGDVRLSVIGDVVYIGTNGHLLRVPVSGGTVEEMTDGVFSASTACAPERLDEAIKNSMPEFESSGASLSFAGTGAEEESTAAAEASDLLPDSASRLYTRAELAGYDSETLGYMRNEILARHGYPFNKAAYREYFGAKSWYVRDESFDYSCLNDTEAANIETIKAIEAAR